jgi:hypothetical protein
MTIKTKVLRHIAADIEEPDLVPLALFNRPILEYC